MKNAIDTTFDFTSDTPHYWDNFWQNCDGLGCGSADPDTKFTLFSDGTSEIVFNSSSSNLSCISGSNEE